MKDRLNKLQKNNVFIYTEPEHYDNGSNMLFSIKFLDYPHAQTVWYNDNHEFGDAGTAMEAAIELAEWYLEDAERIKNINGMFNHYTHIERNKKVSDIINNIVA